MMSKFKKIIIEGSDCSGKSTLMKKIEDMLGGGVHTTHWTAPPKHYSAYAKVNYMNMIHTMGFDLLESLECHVIYDRFVASDYVYFPIFNDGKHNEKTPKFDQALADLGVKQVYVYADEKTIKERLKERGDWLIDESHVERILEGYSKFMLDVTQMETFFYYTGPMSPGVEALQEEMLKAFIME